ncbi:thiol-disulfide isomerase/thioredoxin [Paraburkholderia sp. BL10I2N1]|nr:thiol-disulfide isomerase/thioredoxin [Paraburkholderia sp. BL10I2N1]
MRSASRRRLGAHSDCDDLNAQRFRTGLDLQQAVDVRMRTRAVARVRRVLGKHREAVPGRPGVQRAECFQEIVVHRQRALLARLVLDACHHGTLAVDQIDTLDTFDGRQLGEVVREYVARLNHCKHSVCSENRVEPYLIRGKTRIPIPEERKALAAVRLAARGAARTDADAAILNSVLAGLVVSRLSFVLHYLPAYRAAPVTALDIRDLGFDLLPGVVAGALALGWMLLRRRHVRRAVLVASAVGVLGWSVATLAAGASPQDKTVPRLNLPDLGGHVHPLARDDGKPLVINLWASWCGPCRAEMPVLAEAQRDFGGVDVVFVNQGETRETATGYLSSQRIDVRNLLLDPALTLARAVGARAFPTTLFYDARGTLLAVHLGAFSRATFERALTTLYPAVHAATGATPSP